jgi:pimeloyl-ACP methyl ester carboxylesterase
MIRLENGLIMNYYQKGAERQTLIFTAGFGSPSAYTDYYTLVNGLSESYKTLIYDRPGEGWSDKVNLPLSLESISDCLQMLLRKTDQQPPYVLVAHSFGALEMLHYASRHSNDVKGIILIDGVSPQTYRFFNPNKAIKILTFINQYRWLFRLLVTIKCVPEVNKRQKLLPKEVKAMDKELVKNNFGNRNMIETAKQVKDFAEAVRRDVAIADIPLLVLSCRTSFTELGFKYTNWEADQTYLTRLSKKAKQIFIGGNHSTVLISHPSELQTVMKDFINSLQ